MSTGLQIVLLFLLVAWTAFFVAAEYAFVASRPTRMRVGREATNAYSAATKNAVHATRATRGTI